MGDKRELVWLHINVPDENLSEFHKALEELPLIRTRILKILFTSNIDVPLKKLSAL